MISVYATYLVLTRDFESMKRLPHIFIFFFLFDLRSQTKSEFILHHLLGTILCVCGIHFHVSNELMLMVYTNEITTPLQYAMKYLPDDCTLGIKIMFVGFFYTNRVQNYGVQLLAFDDYAHPYHKVLIATLWALYILNLYWFTVILRKIPSKARVAVAVFASISMYKKLRTDALISF